MPLIVQSTNKHPTSFNLSIINSQMQIATKHIATLEETKVAIVRMYQNGTTQKLSSQAQKAAHALANYIYANKASKKFAFVLGKDYQDQQLLLLTIANHPTKPKVNAALQKVIQPASIDAQKQEDPFPVKQLLWVTEALHKAEFGILFWIYQHRLSSQEALLGTMPVPLPIIVVNFQRPKTPHEQLQAQAWTKMMQVVHNLTSSQLNIHGDDQQLPSQIKITTSDIVLAIQNIIISDDKISKAASKLIKEANIEVQLDDEIGAMTITIKNYGNDKMMTIFGFKATGTPLEVARAKINAAQDGVSWPTKLHELAHGQTPTASHVNAPTKHGVTFKFKLATIINNKGESTLTYEVDVNPQVEGTTPQDVTFVVSGFETQAQATERITAQAQINAAQNKIGVTSPTRLNQVFHGQTPTALDVNAPTKHGVTFKFKLATIINNKGESTLTYEVDANPQVEGTTTKEATFVVSGFETKAQAEKRIVAQAKIDNTQNKIWVTAPTRLNQVFHGQTPIALDVNAPLKDGITFKFKLATAINDKGESTLTYEVDADPQVEGTTTKETTFIVSGFETQVQKDARKVIKNRLDIILQNISDGALEIPEGITSSQFDEYVQAMGYASTTNKFAEQYRAKITSLTIPNSFTTIGSWFHNFNKITSLKLGDKLQTIESHAFTSAKLASLIIPNSITSIGDYAFYHAKLKILTIPNLVTSIGVLAFYNSPLTTLSLGNQLKTIGSQAFNKAQLTSLRIPNLVTTIGDGAFYNSPLATLSLVGDNIQTIKNYAFKSALLTSLSIPNSVTTIGVEAFYNSPLTTLSLGNQLQTIGTSAFRSAELTSLRIPNLVTTIGSRAFFNSLLKSLSLGDHLLTIGVNAFYNALLTSLIIPASVTTIGVAAFFSSPLTNINIFEGVSIGRDAFKNAKKITRILKPI